VGGVCVLTGTIRLHLLTKTRWSADLHESIWDEGTECLDMWRDGDRLVLKDLADAGRKVLKGKKVGNSRMRSTAFPVKKGMARTGSKRGLRSLLLRTPLEN